MDSTGVPTTEGGTACETELIKACRFDGLQ